MTQGNQQAQGQQQGPAQNLGRALTDVRKVQNFMELNHPGQVEAIKMLRETGDLVWGR